MSPYKHVRFKLHLKTERQLFVRCMQNENKILSVFAMLNLHNRHRLSLITKKRFVINIALQRL
jgi:hypothetical protein